MISDGMEQIHREIAALKACGRYDPIRAHECLVAQARVDMAKAAVVEARAMLALATTKAKADLPGEVHCDPWFYRDAVNVAVDVLIDARFRLVACLSAMDGSPPAWTVPLRHCEPSAETLKNFDPHLGQERRKSSHWRNNLKLRVKYFFINLFRRVF